ncbi:hypothetical protein A9G24_06265 [Gilliamella sp. App6-5]|uniref:hypothetical protein n=1 Tax=Gilliamella sp. App6-5 TaxID=3120232 RepID=UPI00080DB404|nr:hypothetical protein [Gilliamella apicola]OCG14735.1 hypothetical protein A9G24_06265 [Gilliamella apicola]
MHYHCEHQGWRLDVLNSSKCYFSQVFSLTSLVSLKFPLALTLLLPYSLNTLALSATTTNIIQGSAPYLTFDGGRTKATTTDGLLSITLSDGRTITPSTNTSTVKKPIVLPNVSDTFANVGMFVPPTTDKVELNTLTGAPYNYLGDDDGDGQGEGGINATGKLFVYIKDNNNQMVSRSDTLDICRSPYKVKLINSNGILSTQYGVPNTSTFNSSSVIYYIAPNMPPKVCYAKPELGYGENWGAGNHAGPADIWNPSKGFLVQSTLPISYDRNFPTTGANGLFFDLVIGGAIDLLTWPTVTNGGITATVTPNARSNTVRVTLTGPAATAAEQQADSTSQISKPILPQTFELVGYDISGKEVVKYGFVLRKWFINRGNKNMPISSHAIWCASIGYRLIKVNDVTNAVCAGKGSGATCEGAVGALPSSSDNVYQRQIGAGLFSEWGKMTSYSHSGFVSKSKSDYWTSDAIGTKQLFVSSLFGSVYSNSPSYNLYGLCTYP